MTLMKLTTLLVRCVVIRVGMRDRGSKTAGAGERETCGAGSGVGRVGGMGGMGVVGLGVAVDGIDPFGGQLDLNFFVVRVGRPLKVDLSCLG